MMPEVSTVQRPELRTIPDVELVKVGAWPASTGDVEITPRDLEAAVKAASSASVRRPVLKLGHVDPRFDGEPAVGYVDNMRLSNDGLTLLGDLKGVPAWLADVMPSAYPDRSIEGQFGMKDQTGKFHDFVLTGLALLGVSPPAVGTLKSLADVATLYGLGKDDSPPGDVTFSMRGEPVVQLSSAVTSEDVRRSFYENGPGLDTGAWLIELFVDPTEAIAEDDAGSLARIPFVVDGDAISWGEMQPVKREYVAASASTSAVKFARGDSPARKDVKVDAVSIFRDVLGLSADVSDDEVKARVAAAFPPAKAEDKPADDSPAGGESDEKPAAKDHKVSEDQFAELADAVGVKADEVDTDGLIEAVKKAVEDAKAVEDEAKEVKASAAEDVVVLDKDRYAELSAAAERGREAEQEAVKAEAETLVAEAVEDGRLAAASKPRWVQKVLDDPEDAKPRLAALASGRVPRAEFGHGGNQDAERAAVEDLTVRAQKAGYLSEPRF